METQEIRIGQLCRGNMMHEELRILWVTGS